MGKFSTRKAVAGGVLTAAGVFGIGAAAAPEALAQLGRVSHMHREVRGSLVG